MMSSLWDSLSIDLGNVSNALYGQAEQELEDAVEEQQPEVHGFEAEHPLSRYVCSSWLSDSGDGSDSSDS